MARFLILSESGDGVGLAFRLKLEGHDVRLWCRSPDADRHGRGIVDLASDYEFGQVVVADCTGFGPILDKLRDSGVPIFGGSSFHDRLESNRKFSEEAMRLAGIDSPRSVRASSWEDAAKQAARLAEKSASGKVVLKPEGGLSGSLPSYVASDPKDALSVLNHWQRTHMAGEVELTVQEFVDGLAVSTEGWFNGEDWIPGLFNHTLERKQFLDGDLGPSGGCSGNAVWKCGERDQLVSGTLLGMTDLLRERRYVGPIDINCLITDSSIYGLEFTPRFGYDALPTLLCSLADFDFGSFLDDVARGRTSDASLSGQFGAGIRLTIPPYPSDRQEAPSGISVREMEDGPPDERMWFYPVGVMMEDEELVSSGGSGIIGVMNGRGEVVGEAFARAYEMTSRLKVADLQYRSDLSRAFLNDLEEFERITSGESERRGWIGVDLDGSIAWHRRGQEGIGRPISEMIARIRRWRNAGREVRIVTARAAIGEDRWRHVVEVYDWLRENLGFTLEVTSEKDPWMEVLYDDRAVELEKNQGVLA